MIGYLTWMIQSTQHSERFHDEQKRSFQAESVDLRHSLQQPFPEQGRESTMRPSRPSQKSSRESYCAPPPWKRSVTDGPDAVPILGPSLRRRCTQRASRCIVSTSDDRRCTWSWTGDSWCTSGRCGSSSATLATADCWTRCHYR